MTGGDPTRAELLLVDDHEVVRQGLRLLLETVLGYTVREAAGALEALAAVEQWVPDVVLLDARMPEHDGIWTLEQLHERHPDLPVLMLSTFDTPDYVDGALERGAAGYLLKEASAEQLRTAIETARTGGGLYLHPAVAHRAVVRRRRDEQEAGALSGRERQILTLLVAGLSNDEIGRTLHLAEKTVKSHLTSLFRKLNVANRTQAVSRALREGLLPDDEQDT